MKKEGLIDLDVDLSFLANEFNKPPGIKALNEEIMLNMLSDYIKSNDVSLKEELQNTLDNYNNQRLVLEGFNTIDIIVNASILSAIITPKVPPSFKEAIKDINESILNYYKHLTNSKTSVELTKQFVVNTVESVSFKSFRIYNMDKYIRYSQNINNTIKARLDFVQEYNLATTTKEKLTIQKKATDWENIEDRRSFTQEYQYNIYDKYEIEKAVNYIFDSLIKENFPNSKSRDLAIKLEESPILFNTTIAIDKLTYTLAAGEIPYRDTKGLKMEKGRSKKMITTFVTLDINNIEDMLPDNINGEDINLLEAIISLKLEGLKNNIDTFSLNDIYRVERRNNDTSPNKKNRQQLKDRIFKLMKTLITIDSSEEKEQYYSDLEYSYTGNLLNAYFLEVSVKGNETAGLKVLDLPILYRYSEAKKQLTNIPFILTDNQLIKTSSVLILEKYLLRRISQMRNRNHLTRKILFSTLYKNMCFNQKSKAAIDNAKAKTRINTEEILKNLIEKDYIKGYHIEKEGRNEYHRLVIEL